MANLEELVEKARQINPAAKECLFVDGEYFPDILFSRYKGIGWDSGRTCHIQLEKLTYLKNNKFDGKELVLVDLRFKKIRYVRNEEESFAGKVLLEVSDFPIYDFV